MCGRIPVIARVTKYNVAYLRSKRERMDHMIDEVKSAPATPGAKEKSGESAGVGRSKVRRKATAGLIVELPFPDPAKDRGGERR